MSETYVLSSGMAEEIKKYIEMKVDGGFNIKTYKYQLNRFDKFCASRDITDVSFKKEDADAWMVKSEEEATTTYYSRVNAIKLFLNYLFLKGYDVYQIRDVCFIPTTFQPHIYTEEETKRYFEAVDRYSSSYNRMAEIQMPVLFRILYSCGTRIEETLSIQKKDVDLNNGVIYLKTTKNRWERYAVLSDELNNLMKLYANKCFYLLGEDDFIFQNDHGRRYNEKTIYEIHRKLLHAASIPYKGSGEGPRIHDWRHHMAVYSFKQLSDSGMDMYAALPILSAYLGHRTIYATERYVRLTMDLFPHIEEKFKDKLETVFNRVEEIYDEDN